MRYGVFMGAIALFASAALAAPLTGNDARNQLFEPASVEVKVLDLPFLSDQDKQVLPQIAADQRYYGAIAFGPDDGLLSESLAGAFNFHDVASASAAAVKDCETRRTGNAACQVVLELRPKGWAPDRAISLSGDATVAFDAQYRKAKSPKAMAVSPSTGLFAVATDAAAPGTAQAQCDALAQAGDCTVVLSE